MKKIILIVLMSAPLLMVHHICEGSIMDRLCESFTSVLDDEEAKTDAAVKNCKSKCDWVKKKKELIAAAQKKVDDSCAKGITPDITKISAGLDKNVQAKLRKQYNQHSKMYDGKADLPDKDFDLTTKLNQSPVSTGKGGRVTDLKASEPAIPKLNTASEFSLSGTKLSGETPDRAATKPSPALLALASSAKSPAAAAASVAENQSPAKSQLASFNDGNYNQACLQLVKLNCGCTWDGVCTPEALKCFEEKKETCRISGCSAGYIMTTFSGCCLASQVTTTGICCPPGQTPVADRCGCSAGKVTIDGPKDLFLSKPYTDSKRETFKIVTTGKSPTNVQWSLSNAKVKFTMGINKPTVQVIPAAESESPDDVTISATVDNCPPPQPITLTVRRPKLLSHPPLKFKKENYVVWTTVGTDKQDDSFKKYEFPWTLVDQFGKPMPNILINEEVRKGPGSSRWAWWYLPWFQSDTYYITGQATTNLTSKKREINCF